jgi:Transposase DDE domain
MAEQPSSVLAMLTEFFSGEHIEATARRTGFVQRTSKITGKLFLALITFGSWGDAKTTLAQLAAKATQLGTQVTVSPEALYQRMNKRALAFLQEMICTALAKIQACAPVGDESLFAPFARVHIADSTGFGLPDSLQDTFPGAGGSAAQAGAKIQLVWEYKQSVFTHFALMPWNIPDQKYIDTVVEFAQNDDLFLFDLGYFKITALAQIAAAHAYFLCRLNHQTTLLEVVADRVAPVELARRLATVERPILEQPILIGATAQVAARLIAARVPEEVVNARRRIARKNAKKKGYTPSQAHLTLLAWNLFITNVPETIWQPPTVLKVYPIRWQVELIFKSWKSYLHLASIKTTKEAPTLCYLYGRMLLILLNYALCPQIRAALWEKQQREVSVLKLVRHCQAFAERWMQAIFQSAFELRRLLQQVCTTAERLVVKASRKRRTTAQILRESLENQGEAAVFMEVVNA